MLEELSDTEIAELRDGYLRQIIEPVVRWAFEKFPHIQSCTLRVAQYWDDEANDAVHADLVFSELETPHLRKQEDDDEGVSNFDVTPILKKEAPWGSWKFINLDSGKYHWEPGEPRHQHTWSENWLAIPLFAAWCKEGATQETEREEAYSPYCTYRKTKDGVSREIHPMLREWLNGVTPEWEDEERCSEKVLRKIEREAPPSIIGEDIPFGDLTDEVRRMLDGCGKLISYETKDWMTGEMVPGSYVCTAIRMRGDACRHTDVCPFKKKEVG